MQLKHLIETLKKHDPNLVVPHGFGFPHSYRGYYEDLAFIPRENVTVGSMLWDAEVALGSTYQGWKGGDFRMVEYTEVWLADEGHEGESLGSRLLAYMLAEAHRP